MDSSPLTRGAWYGRLTVVVLGVLMTAVLVQRESQWWILAAVFLGVVPAGWAVLDLAVRSGLGQGWRVGAIFGGAMFLLSGCFVVGDLWRLAVGDWEQAVVAGEESSCVGDPCTDRYSVTLVGLPGAVHEDFSGQFPVGSGVRILVDPTGLVGPSPDGERDRLGWAAAITAAGAIPVTVTGAAAFRRARRVPADGPPW